MVMSVAAGVLIYLNWTAEDRSDTPSNASSPSSLFRLSLGNTWLHYADEGPGRVYGAACAAIFFFFLVNLMNMREDYHLLHGRTIRNTAASYSVKLRGLPKRLSARRLAEYLVYNYGPLEALVVVNRDGTVCSGCCDACLEHVNVAHNKAVRDAGGRSARSAPPDPLRGPVASAGGKRPSMVMDGRRVEVDEAPQRAPAEAGGPPVNSAHFHEFRGYQLVIATFQYSVCADRMVFDHRDTWIWRLCCCFLRCRSCGGCDCHPPFYYGRRLRATRPREPSDYNWGNYRVRTRWCRVFLSLVATAAILVGYFLIITWAHGSRDELPTEVAFAFGAALSVFNLVAEFFFLSLTALERHKSKSTHQLSMVLKKATVDFLNNVVIMLLVTGLPAPNLSADPNLDWYSRGGALVTSVIVADSVIPTLVRVFHPVHRLKRFFVALCCSDERVERAYVPSISIYNNFISFLASLTWVFLYATALPVAIPLTVVKLAGMYWVEKYNVLRRYGRPDMIDAKSAHVVLSVVPFAYILAAAFTVAAVRGQPDVEDAYDYRDDELSTSAQRVMVPALYAAIVIVVGTRVLGWFFGGVLGIRKCKQQRASRFRPTCCWEAKREPFFRKRREPAYAAVPEIESYLFPAENPHELDTLKSQPAASSGSPSAPVSASALPAHARR